MYFYILLSLILSVYVNIYYSSSFSFILFFICCLFNFLELIGLAQVLMQNAPNVCIFDFVVMEDYTVVQKFNVV